MIPLGKKRSPSTPIILTFNAIPIHMPRGFFNMEEQRAKRHFNDNKLEGLDVPNIKVCYKTELLGQYYTSTKTETEQLRVDECMCGKVADDASGIINQCGNSSVN